MADLNFRDFGAKLPFNILTLTDFLELGAFCIRNLFKTTTEYVNLVIKKIMHCNSVLPPTYLKLGDTFMVPQRRFATQPSIMSVLFSITSSTVP